MSFTDTDLISKLQYASLQTNRYLGIFIFIFGLVGNVANILVLSQRSLRSNPCAYLFLFSSISNFIAILFGLVSRFLSTWSMDLTATNQFLCKFRAFVVFSSITCGFWFIVLATVDRWLSSSSQGSLRQKSTLKNAQRGMIVVFILSMIIQGHHIYCFEANLTNAPVKCYTSTPTCRLLSDLTIVFGALLFPLLFMVIFSLLTISNVRQSHSRVQMNNENQSCRVMLQTTNSSNGQENQHKRIDRQLLKMLFVQVLLIVPFTLPLAIQKFYTTITADMVKSPLQNKIEIFLFNLFLLLYYVACGMSFYVNTLSGGVVFRQGVITMTKNVVKSISYR